MSSKKTNRGKPYTHRITRMGGLCSEHTSLQLAEKARGRLVAMSNGRLTAADFEINPILKPITVTLVSKDGTTRVVEGVSEGACVVIKAPKGAEGSPYWWCPVGTFPGEASIQTVKGKATARIESESEEIWSEVDPAFLEEVAVAFGDRKAAR